MALNNLFTVFTGRIQDWLLALTQHVQISLSALLAAIFISIPLLLKRFFLRYLQPCFFLKSPETQMLGGSSTLVCVCPSSYDKALQTLQHHSDIFLCL